MSFEWPQSFPRVPDEPWTRQRVEELALDYDTVEHHGWYANLDRTVGQLEQFLGDGDLLLDYSGGTGILEERLLERVGGRGLGIVIVDSSRKFLRLALEKFADEPRIAFRILRYLEGERRLQYSDEVLERPLLARGADAIASTNAIHLYHNLEETLHSWHRVLRPDGRVFVQSGNIDNPACPEGQWIIDRTVGVIHRTAMQIVRTDAGYAAYRGALEDEEHMGAHDALRRKYFVPVRPLDDYLAVLGRAGFEILSIDRAAIEARVDQWFEFLSVYHEGVLGWVGGAEKVTGEAAPDDIVDDRLALMRRAMERIFEGWESFDACWTYITCAPEG